MTSTRTIPMFPLGGVLLPHQVLPLHVFEPRYQALVEHVLEEGGEFGVCLIARGSEVGGEDVRTDWGAVAKVLRAESLEDGRWLLVTVGTSRFDVVEWLDDDPYPRARIVDLDEPTPGDEDAAARDRVGRRLRRVLALMSELGMEAAPATTELDDDVLVASFQASVLAPVGPLDKLRLLRSRTASERFEVLEALLEGLEEQLDLEIGLGVEGGPDPEDARGGGGSDDGPGPDDGAEG